LYAFSALGKKKEATPAAGKKFGSDYGSSLTVKQATFCYAQHFS
jgi:hypothetical protein